MTRQDLLDVSIRIGAEYAWIRYVRDHDSDDACTIGLGAHDLDSLDLILLHLNLEGHQKMWHQASIYAAREVGGWWGETRHMEAHRRYRVVCIDDAWRSACVSWTLKNAPEDDETIDDGPESR
jgi:hypothetical protein